MFLVYANYLIVLGFGSFGFEIWNFCGNSGYMNGSDVVRSSDREACSYWIAPSNYRTICQLPRIANHSKSRPIIGMGEIRSFGGG